MKFRRATLDELKAIGYKLPSEHYKHQLDFVKKYYPKEAYTLTIAFHSEYNDCDYENNIKYVVVHDKEGNELPPLKKTANECRENWFELYNYNNSTRHPMEDVVITLSTELPEFYVKED
jgi:hypothetical protein